MKFWLIEDKTGEILGCELTKRAAEETARSFGCTEGEYSVSSIEVEVTADNVRRLLGGLGGYAKP